MSGVDKFKFIVVRDVGDYSFELAGEFDLCLDEIELGNGIGCSFDRGKLFAERFGQLKKDPRDLAFLFAF